MPRRRSPFDVLNPIVMVIAGALVLSQAGFAKDASDLLGPTRAKLAALEACLGQNSDLDLLKRGLLVGWRKGAPKAPTLKDWPPPPPPPPEYLVSLDQDIQVCDLASRLRDEEQRRIILKDVQKDIQVKASDCRNFGMGRKVPVSVTTVRGAKTENGWQVFYKWACSTLLQPDEVRVPNLTSPANIELPPGVYSVRAEKRISSIQVQKVAPVTIVVGSAAAIPLQLAIE